MSGTEITPEQTIRINLLKMVGYDTAAAAKAIEYVADEILKFTMLEMQHNRPELNPMEPVARVIKAIQESKEALSLFGPLTA
ncbi:DUF2560 family protein [Serratia sp. IR-2025]